MIKKTLGELQWLEFELFSSFKKLKHGVFLRHGGVSTDKLSSLNFGILTADPLSNVLANKEKAKNAIDLKNLYWLHQAHGNDVIEAKEKEFDFDHLKKADGLLTEQKNLGLMVKHADCQAAIFYDPIEHVLANIHCGWRGNVKNIYAQTVEKMSLLYRSQPANIHVGISPSLGPQASEFINYKTELPQEFWQFQIKPTFFDLWEISKCQLIQAGILENHIQIAQICTFSNPQDWFSYRLNKESGRHATIAALL